MPTIRRTIAAVATAATLTVAGGAAADAAGKPTPHRTEQICANHAQILKALNNRAAATTQRIANLEKAVARAKAAGHTVAARRLEAALARAKGHLAKINMRIDKLKAFVAAKCD